MGLRILVTGGAGYIGTTLVPYLIENGHHVTVLDNLMYGAHGLRGVWGHERFQFVRGDVLDEEKVILATCGVDVVVHLAAIVGAAACKAAPARAKTVNCCGAEFVAQMARANKARCFLLASTCSNYGVSEQGYLVDEQSPLRPTSVYAETKIAAEKAVLALETATFCPVVARFATVFGASPRMRFDTTINEFTRDAYVQRRLLLYNAQAWRPFVHVYDLSRAIMNIVQVASGRLVPLFGDNKWVINVGGHNRRKEDLATALLENVHGLAVERRDGNPDPRDYQVSFKLLEDTMMGKYWACRTPESGLNEIISALDAGLYDDPYSERWTNAPTD